MVYVRQKPISQNALVASEQMVGAEGQQHEPRLFAEVSGCRHRRSKSRQYIGATSASSTKNHSAPSPAAMRIVQMVPADIKRR